MHSLRRALSAASLLCAATMGMILPATAEETDNGFISLQVENDLFAKLANTDRHYTNGLQAAWLSAPRNDLPEWLNNLSAPPLFGLFTDDANVASVTRRIGVNIGQEIFTPDDTDATAPLLHDRPYAAWLHSTFTLQSVRENAAGGAWQDQWKLDLGVVGPWALGRQVQNGWHKLINVEQANGWTNQLRNEPTVNVSFERAWRSERTDSILFDLDTDTIPYGVVALGNAQTYAGVGAIIRLGPDLPDDFGPSRIYPGIGGSDWFRATPGFDWYVFSGGELRGVARDIFLDGNTFRDSQSVDKKPVVADVKLGATAILGDTRLSFTHVFRSKEFYGQPKADQFGSITLTFGL